MQNDECRMKNKQESVLGCFPFIILRSAFFNRKVFP